MHQNDVFFILKKLFLRSAHQNDLKHKNKFSKKKNKILAESNCSIKDKNNLKYFKINYSPNQFYFIYSN